jgi:hypothetical protein
MCLEKGWIIRVNRVGPAGSLRAQSSTTWLTSGLLQLAKKGFYLIFSAIFQCMEYTEPLAKVTQDTFLFYFCSQSVSRVNTALFS